MRRLERLVARNLGISRREVTRLLRRGRVCTYDGAPLRPGADTYLTTQDPPYRVRIDGAEVTLRTRVDLLQHKPLGCVTALKDDEHPTAHALLRDAPLWQELRAVGRLDKETSGLLLWTTDGETVHTLTHPRYEVQREYHVALTGPATRNPPVPVLRDGHRPSLQALEPIARADLHPSLHPWDGSHFATVTLTGGRYHEVRRLFAALGNHVVGLCRVRFGAHELPRDLSQGAWVEVTVSPRHAHE